MRGGLLAGDRDSRRVLVAGNPAPPPLASRSVARTGNQLGAVKVSRKIEGSNRTTTLNKPSAETLSQMRDQFPLGL